MFQKNSNNYSNIYPKGIWYIILGMERARENRTSKCKADQQSQGAGDPEIQKAKIPEF